MDVLLRKAFSGYDGVSTRNEVVPDLVYIEDLIIFDEYEEQLNRKVLHVNESCCD